MDRTPRAPRAHRNAHMVGTVMGVFAVLLAYPTVSRAEQTNQTSVSSVLSNLQQAIFRSPTATEKAAGQITSPSDIAAGLAMVEKREEHYRAPFLAGIIGRYADDHGIQKAVAFARTLPDWPEKADALPIAIGRRDVNAGLALAESLWPTGQVSAGVMEGEILWSWVGDDYTNALPFLTKMPQTRIEPCWPTDWFCDVGKKDFWFAVTWALEGDRRDGPWNARLLWQERECNAGSNLTVDAVFARLDQLPPDHVLQDFRPVVIPDIARTNAPEALRLAQTYTNDAIRRDIVARAIEQWSESEPVKALNYIRSHGTNMGFTSVDDWTHRRVLQNLGEQQPQYVLKYVLHDPSVTNRTALLECSWVSDGVAAGLVSLAQTRPSAFLSEIENLKSTVISNACSDFYVDIYEELVETNASTAISLVNAIQDAKVRSYVYASVRDTFEQTWQPHRDDPWNPDTILRDIARIDDVKTRSDLRSWVVSEVVDRDPLRAKRLVQSLSSRKERGQFSKDVVAHLTPKEAAGWALACWHDEPEGPTILDHALTEWSEDTGWAPVECMEWIIELGTNIPLQMFSVLATNLAQCSHRIENDQIIWDGRDIDARTNSLTVRERPVLAVLETNVQAAAAMILGFKPHPSPVLAKLVASKWAKDDPVGASRWVENLPQYSFARDVAALIVYRHWYPTNAFAAARWYVAIRKGQSSEGAGGGTTR